MNSGDYQAKLNECCAYNKLFINKYWLNPLSELVLIWKWNDLIKMCKINKNLHKDAALLLK